MFKEYLDQDLVDPVERKEIFRIIDALNKEGLLYTSPLYKMKKNKIEINYAKLWAEICVAYSSKRALNASTWISPKSLMEKEALRKKVAQAEIDPKNPLQDDDSTKAFPAEKKGWGFVTQDKDEHLKSLLPKEDPKSRHSATGLSTMTSLLSTLTETPITVESISTDVSENVIVVKTSSDEPISPNVLMARAAKKLESDKESRSSTPDTSRKLPDVVTVATKTEVETKEELDLDRTKKTSEPPRSIDENAAVIPKVMTPKGDVKIGKVNGAQSKTLGSPKKMCLSDQKASTKDSNKSEQKERLKTIMRNNLSLSIMDATNHIPILKHKDSGILNGTKEEMKKDMEKLKEKMKCYGCSKKASDLYKNSFPKTFIGKANQQMAFPRVCNRCFSENEQFFCSKKCLSSGEKIHLKTCKGTQNEKNKKFIEKLGL